MHEPHRFPVKPPVFLTLAGLLMFAGCTAFFAHMAWTGNTDIYRLRHLPISQDAKVGVPWGFAAVSLAMTGLAPSKILAILRPAILEIGPGYAVVPYGVGLRKQVRLAAGENLLVYGDGAGPAGVLHVRWKGGRARLPESWFTSPEEAERALTALRGLALTPSAAPGAVPSR